MKTYSTNKYLQRLANFLVAYAVPFSYDGFTIEFTASQRLVDEMQNLDKVLLKLILLLSNIILTIYFF